MRGALLECDLKGVEVGVSHKAGGIGDALVLRKCQVILIYNGVARIESCSAKGIGWDETIVQFVLYAWMFAAVAFWVKSGAAQVLPEHGVTVVPLTVYPASAAMDSGRKPFLAPTALAIETKWPCAPT